METVTGRSSALVQQTDLKQDVFHVAANSLARRGSAHLFWIVGVAFAVAERLPRRYSEPARFA